MIRSKLPLSLCLLTALAFAPMTGCGDSKGTTSDTSAETDSESGTTAGPGGSSTSSPETSDGSSGGPGTTTSDPTTDPSTTTGTMGGPCDDVVDRKDAGEECQLDCECKFIKDYDPDSGTAEYDPDSDGKCFVVPLIGGLCGECTSADDCAGGGCTIPNPLQSTPSYCNEGNAGDGCDADGANTCQGGLVCGTVLDAAGIITVSTCGECQTSDDCTDPNLPNCAPELDVPGFTGQLKCVADGALTQNAACVIGEDSACETGVCSVAVVMGVIQVGICGECDANNPCDMGSCVDAFVNLDVDPNMPEDALQGSVCQ